MEAIISRSELYGDSEAQGSNDFSPLQELDFDIVEKETSEAEEEPEEFDFPLFAATSVQKVNLKQPVEDAVVQARPRSFYFAEWSSSQRAQFKDMAISGEDVLTLSETTSVSSGKVINLDEHNKMHERGNKKPRPGKARRLNRILSKRRAAETAKRIAELAEEKRKIMKKRRRGGVKNKRAKML